MEIEKIEIENYKGIQYLEIDFNKSPESKFFTFVGLNESGKTTILEAINNFCYGNEPIVSKDSEKVGVIKAEDMIPVSQRGNFNDSINITFHVFLTNADKKHLLEELKKINKNILEIKINDHLDIRYEIEFKNSTYIPSPRHWGLSFSYREKRKFININKATDDLWQRAAKILTPLFPDIIYFPNSLVDFPQRIYLESKSEVNIFYTKIFQDILSSMGCDYELERHILTRMKNNDSSVNQQLKAVFNDVRRELTKTVLYEWKEIFSNTDFSDTQLSVDYGLDEKQQPYVEFQIEDKNGITSINERSLGFRWFFIFRLLTHYRAKRNVGYKDKKVLFLLDEPASNLHQSAQQKLLKCFEMLPSHCYLLYTTHSHHLINPKWIENLYIVKNDAMDYESSQFIENQTTNITLTRYRNFVEKNPSKISYFQPILDALDYQPSKLELINNVLFVEGKNDYYTLRYMKEVLNKNLGNIDFIPVSKGCGGMDILISLYMGWGKNFHILLDGDKKISESIEHYNKEWGIIIESKLHTLTDMLFKSKNMTMESLFSNDDKTKILKEEEIDHCKKNAFNRKIQALLMQGEILEFTEETIVNFNLLFEFIEELFQ